MQFVEDETHNIMKMYEYNNVSQAKQAGCPAAFTNPAINEQVPATIAGQDTRAAVFPIPFLQASSRLPSASGMPTFRRKFTFTPMRRLTQMPMAPVR